MKNTLLLFLLLFSIPVAHGQETVNPIRVSAIPATKESIDLQSIEAFQLELRRLKYVIVAEKRLDYSVLVATTAITSHGPYNGYAVAMLVVNENNRQAALLIYTGDDLRELAHRIVEKLESEFFKKQK